MTKRALFGATGFVGQNLRRQASFDLEFSRKNSDFMQKAQIDDLILCGLPAEKWRANLDPKSDWSNIQRVKELISTVHAERVLLISTVDVYSVPIGVDEDSNNFHTTPGYGLNRLLFERFVTERFPCVTILRLPAIFGPGLKKNALFDMLYGNQIENISLNSSFQWYPLEYLWRDAERVRNAGISVCNFAVEPLPTRDWITRFFPDKLALCNVRSGPNYDIYTRHAALFESCSKYILGREAVLESMGRFIREVQR
jgi:nucleoside-diphosphate-sugar epimerase